MSKSWEEAVCREAAIDVATDNVTLETCSECNELPEIFTEGSDEERSLVSDNSKLKSLLLIPRRLPGVRGLGKSGNRSDVTDGGGHDECLCKGEGDVVLPPLKLNL